jgi:hypothetical protein
MTTDHKPSSWSTTVQKSRVYRLIYAIFQVVFSPPFFIMSLPLLGTHLGG